MIALSKTNKDIMIDLWGNAIYDHYFERSNENLITATNISEPENMPVSYLFRDYGSMPELEKTALGFCSGNVLDVGCGAGSHALFLQDNRRLETTAVDVSEKAVEICKLRGLRNAVVADIFEFSPNKKFDTILLLMNGTGICGNLDKLDDFLLKLTTLMTESGQILVESSDLQYMYKKKDLNLLHKGGKYYGELRFSMSYKGRQSPDFNWLYVDFETLKIHSAKFDLICTKVFEGNDDEFLARIVLKNM